MHIRDLICENSAKEKSKQMRYPSKTHSNSLSLHFIVNALHHDFNLLYLTVNALCFVVKSLWVAVSALCFIVSTMLSAFDFIYNSLKQIIYFYFIYFATPQIIFFKN